MSDHPLFIELLQSRGLNEKKHRDEFISPIYSADIADPYLLPDMELAVNRLIEARNKNQKVYIYGDYDIDGLSATSLLLDAFGSFGIDAHAFIPNRFSDGYGLSVDAIKKIADDGADLIVTVDCGSLSHAEIEKSNELGVDVIVTDHHHVEGELPNAIAVVNPKRVDNEYPFNDFSAVGVAFKLVQAMQGRTEGMPVGHEKWLLDLVALGTVCDVVELRDENRINVHWGLKVLQKTRRPGLKALMAVAKIEPEDISARTLGYIIGPRLNASGRMESARLSLDLLTTNDPSKALEIAQQLDDKNTERRADQTRIMEEALVQAEQFKNDPVLVLSSPNWSHGIIGIVAAKLLEKHAKPVFILQEIGDTSKGSARSYGDFSAVEGVKASDKWLISGGGHHMAAGVTLKTENISNFRKAINDYYKKCQLVDQHRHLAPSADISRGDLQYLDEALVQAISLLEPYGHGNPEPVFYFRDIIVNDVKKMGSDNQHVKLFFSDAKRRTFCGIAFGAPAHYFVEPGEVVNVWCRLSINEWRGAKSVEGRIIQLETT